MLFTLQYSFISCPVHIVTPVIKYDSIKIKVITSSLCCTFVWHNTSLTPRPRYILIITDSTTTLMQVSTHVACPHTLLTTESWLHVSRACSKRHVQSIYRGARVIQWLTWLARAAGRTPQTRLSTPATLLQQCKGTYVKLAIEHRMSWW